MYGKCTKKDAGISSQLETASVNSMKISLDKNTNKETTTFSVNKNRILTK